jgi:hypothetical protein
MAPDAAPMAYLAVYLYKNVEWLLCGRVRLVNL